MLKRFFSFILPLTFCSFILISTTQAKGVETAKNKSEPEKTTLNPYKQQRQDFIDGENRKRFLDSIRKQYGRLVEKVQRVENIILTNKRDLGLPTKEEQDKARTSLSQIRSFLMNIINKEILLAEPHIISLHSKLIGHITLRLQKLLTKEKLNKISVEDFLKSNMKLMAELKKADQTNLDNIPTILKENAEQDKLLNENLNTIGFGLIQNCWAKLKKKGINKKFKRCAKWGIAGTIGLSCLAIERGFFPSLKRMPNNFFFNPIKEAIDYSRLSHLDKQQNLAPLLYTILTDRIIQSISAAPFIYAGQKFLPKILEATSVESDIDSVEEAIDEKYEQFFSYLEGEKIILKSDKHKDPNLRIDNIIGQESVKEELRNILNYIANPDRYAHLGITGDIGLLLYGEPGSGKTMAIDILAAEAKRRSGQEVHVIHVNNKFLERYSIKEIHTIAKNMSGIVILVYDECDKVIFGEQRIEEFQSCMGGTDHGKKIIVVGTTNHLYNLSSAMIREGRFGTYIPVELPTLNERIKFFEREVEFRNIKDIPASLFIEMAKEAEGATLGTLKKIIDGAFEIACKEASALHEKHFQPVFNKKVRKILSAKQVPLEDEVMFAVYQVGTAFIRNLINTERKVSCITTFPVKKEVKSRESQFSFSNQDKKKTENDQLTSKKYKKYTNYGATFTTAPSSWFQSSKEKNKELYALLAGQQALKLILGEEYPDYMPEHNAESLDIIKRQLARGEKITQEIVDEALARQSAINEHLLEILTPYKESLKKPAAKLMKEKIIYGEEWNLDFQEALKMKSKEDAKEADPEEKSTTLETLKDKETQDK